MKKALIGFLLLALLVNMAFPILVSDSLSRGKYYSLKFKLSSDKNFDRYIGLYTQRTLDADMFLFDEDDKMIAKVSGTAGKYPNSFTFPGPGIYSARVMAYSGDGPFLMVISDREELKKILKDVK